MNKLWTNMLWKMTALSGSKLLVFLLFLVSARFLSIADFGFFMFALAFAHLAFVIMDAGVSTALWREASTASDHGIDAYRTSHRLRVPTVVLGAVSIAIGIYFFTMPLHAQMMFVLVGIGIIFDAFLQLDLSLFKAREQLRHDAVTMLIDRLLFVGLGVILIYFGGGLISLGIAFLVGHIGGLIWARRINQFEQERLFASSTQSLPLLKFALPLAAVALFTEIYFRIDVVMLQAMIGAESAGLYGSAYRLIEAAMLIPAALLSALFPALAKQSESAPNANMADRAISLLVHIAAAGIVFGFVFAPEILMLLFGPSYNAATTSLRLLLISLAFIYPNYLLTNLLVVQRKQNYFAFVVVSCALFNVTANALLIRLLGMSGAAIATLLTEALLFGLAWKNLRSSLTLLTLQKLAIPLLYGAILLGILYAVRVISLPFSIICGLVCMTAWIAVAAFIFHRREVR